MTVAPATVRSIAAVGLGVPSTIVVEPIDNRSVLHELRAHRLEGVAVSALLDGTIEADERFGESLVQQHDETMAQTLRVEIMAVRVSDLLLDNDVPHRVLKGTALAHTVARSPSERSFRDVDVLVHGSEMDRVVALLTNLGATRNQPQLRPGFDGRFGKSVTMKLDGVEIDLHRLFCAGPFGVWMHPGDLFLLRDTVHVGGTPLPTLDWTDHLLHACYHVALGSAVPALVNLRDVALLAAGDWDSERFGQTVDRWRGHAVVRRAVRLVVDELDAELPETLMEYRHVPVAQAQRDLIIPYLSTDARGRFAELAPATLRALPIADRVAFARAVGLPEGSDVRGRLRAIVDRTR